MTNNIPILDCDVHLHEVAEELAEYCEMPWRKALETIDPEATRVATLAYGDPIVPGLAPGAGDGSDTPWPGGINRPIAEESPQQCRQDLDSMGIGPAILFPDHLLKINLFNDGEYAMALARAYNRWMVDKWLSIPNFYGAICTAAIDPEGSAAEIRKYANHDKMVCAYLPACAVNPLFGDKRYWTIYETAQELNIPVSIHGLVSVWPVFPMQLEQFNEVGRHGFGHSLQMCANFMSLMADGIPARFPDLKISFNEGGLAWVPWLIMRLNNEYFEHRGRLLPFLKERPSHYMSNFLFSTQPAEEPDDPADYLKVIELAGGPERIIYASDWPHHDFDHPSRILDYPMPDDAKRKIMGKNAAEFYGIPLPGG